MFFLYTNAGVNHLAEDQIAELLQFPEEAFEKLREESRIKQLKDRLTILFCQHIIM
jgi:uncharacterized membrane protein